MDLLFCPNCRHPSTRELCPTCGVACDSPARTYIEKLLGTVVSAEPERVGMAVDVLAKRLREPRALVPLSILAQSDVDAHRLVMAARGLGWLGDRAAVPVLAALLMDPEKPFVARVAAAQSLGMLGGEQAITALSRSLADARPSVRQACAQALEELKEKEVDKNTYE